MGLGEDDILELEAFIAQAQALLGPMATTARPEGFYVIGPVGYAGIKRALENARKILRGEMIDYDQD